MHLYIAPSNPTLKELYETAAKKYNDTPYSNRDSGFDLFCDGEDIDDSYSKFANLIGQGCRALALDNVDSPRAYWLTPRSSISKTNMRMANSMGLMDATYRGIVKAALYSTTGVYSMSLHGQRLVQVVQPSLLPWESVSIVEQLPGSNTLRDQGGFGSTGI